tara:strand:+ start:7177 stop:7527 length:351 start_codon:yes stop_codon:yes gene_type:complete
MSASFAIAVFVNGVALGVFMLPRMFKTFTDNPFANLVLRRCCYVIALYLFTLNSAIMATIATAGNIGVSPELFRYMWLFGTAGWVAMLYLVIKTLFDLKDMYKSILLDKRMGKTNG